MTTARLPMDPADPPPASILLPREANPLPVVIGAAVSLTLHLGVLAVAAALALVTSVGVLASAKDEDVLEPAIEEDDVIEARFVQLGRELDPRQLPNRRVPLLPQAAPVPVAAPSPEPVEDQEPVEDSLQPEDDPDLDVQPRRPERPVSPDAVEGLLENLADRAEAFAERERIAEQEGSPDGVEGGTETAEEGNVYRGRIATFFRRGWSVPTTLPAEVVRGLTAVVEVEIGEDLRIAGYRLRQPSGNPLFDESALAQIQRLKDAGTPIPPPPEEVAHLYVGRTTLARFRGRDVR
ncbi:MAG: TonB C-terminal domain-containing protein [Sandaracinaceae bacterium]